jgi:hypothetical protein
MHDDKYEERLIKLELDIRQFTYKSVFLPAITAATITVIAMLLVV